MKGRIMQSLKARVKGCLGLASSTIGICLMWSNALGQSEPDPVPIPVSEPASATVFAFGVVAIAAWAAYKKRK